MIKKIKIFILLVLCLSFFGGFSNYSYANPVDKVKEGARSASDDRGTSADLTGLIKQIINVLLFIAGMVAVIMIVIGGLRYITSDGDSGRITQAKQTVLYAIIGLIVAILAYAIVNFVISNL